MGLALLTKNKQEYTAWDPKGLLPKGIPIGKSQVEQSVAETLGNMWVLCLPIKGKALHDSIKYNAIALLSNYYKHYKHYKQTIDPPSKSWLGRHCTQPKVQESGLWNQHHVDGTYDPAFLDTLEGLILNL